MNSMGSIAIIETGGKQYLIKPNDKIFVEKLEGEKGSKVEFEKVLLSGEEIGKPYLEGKKVSAEILEQKRLPKVTVFKYHSKTRYRKKKGHRQSVTRVAILSLT